jgi:hypothetical protein
MGDIEVKRDVHNRIGLLALAWGISEGDAVERLLDHFQQTGQQRREPRVDARVNVHAVYEGFRTEGLFIPSSGGLEITSGPLAGQRFNSPSGAAVAVVQAAKPGVNPNRNGWSFWVQTDTGEMLQMIRRRQ